MIEDKIQESIKPIISIYTNIEIEIIKKLAEHFNINGEFINSDFWYIEKLKEMGAFNTEVIEILEKYTGRTKQELLLAMNNIGIASIPKEQLNIAKQYGKLLDIDAIINSVNVQNIIQYSYNEIEKSFLQLNKNIEAKVRQIYKDIVTKTYIKTISGVYSYQQVITECLDELGNKGITILEYQTDRGIRKYDVVGTVRRDLLCATRGLAGKVNEEVIKESGHHVVRVSHHFGARTGDGKEDYTNHAWWQEKQFFCWDYDGKATDEEKKLPDFMKHCNYGNVQGIVGINCKHFFTVWYGSLKKDKLDFNYEENEEQYKKTQQQRYLENGIRKWKRKLEIAKKIDDKEGYKKVSIKVKEWQNRTNEFCNNNNLKRDFTREYVKTSTKLDKDGIMLNDKEKNAIRNYTSFDATRINKELRLNNVTDEIQKKIDILDSAIQKSEPLKESMVVYRGTIIQSIKGFEKNKNVSHEEIMNLSEKIISDRAFISTSKIKPEEQGRNIIMNIELPNGFKGALEIKEYSTEKYKYQDEVLLKRNTKFIVKEIVYKNGKYYFNMEALE